MPEDFEIIRWLDASWCPDPYSKKQMGYPCELIRDGGTLVIGVRKRRKGRPMKVAELPPFVCNMHDLERYHDAGAFVHVEIIGSDRSRRRAKFRLVLSGKDAAKYADAVAQVKASELDRRHAEREHEAAKGERRQARRRAMIGFVGRSARGLTRAGVSGAKATVTGARRGWASLVEWTNKEPG